MPIYIVLIYNKLKKTMDAIVSFLILKVCVVDTLIEQTAGK
jgi:hypothetical protein